jgi:hypothetical protein
MKNSNRGKKSGPDAVREEYLKKMNSPIYRKKIKRSMQQLLTYNRIVHNNKLEKYELRKIAEYFLEDIKSPVMSRVTVDQDTDDSLKSVQKPMNV